MPTWLALFLYILDMFLSTVPTEKVILQFESATVTDVLFFVAPVHL